MTEGPEKVLIAGGESAARAALRANLEEVGFLVFDAIRDEEALTLVRSTALDALLLDTESRADDGIESCMTIRRAAPSLPILVLSDLYREDCKVDAFQAGADDYITKPFQPRELVARLRAVMRRSRPRDTVRSEILIGDVLLDTARHLVKKAGRPVHLTPKQFDLLHCLMKNAGKVVPHTKLLRLVWGPEYGDELEYLRTYVRQLRIKIENDPASPQYLLTEPYIGYRFAERISAESVAARH